MPRSERTCQSTPMRAVLALALACGCARGHTNNTTPLGFENEGVTTDVRGAGGGTGPRTPAVPRPTSQGVPVGRPAATRGVHAMFELTKMCHEKGYELEPSQDEDDVYVLRMNDGDGRCQRARKGDGGTPAAACHVHVWPRH